MKILANEVLWPKVIVIQPGEVPVVQLAIWNVRSLLEKGKMAGVI